VSSERGSAGNDVRSRSRSIGKVLLWVLSAVSLMFVAAGCYVGLTAGLDLLAARAVMSADLDSLTSGELREARVHLRNALDDLRSPPSQLLGLVPGASANRDALRAIVDASLVVLDPAIELEAQLEELDLVRDGEIQLESLEELEPTLDRQVAALQSLAADSEDSLNGWLVPPLYEEVADLAVRSRALGEGLGRLRRVLDVAPALLGVDERRTYLVLLVNNSELRGSGGVLTGLGTLNLQDGRLTMGRFFSVHDLPGRKPYVTVDAPSEYERRFADYKANSSLLLNTTFSADFPDVARVAANVYDELLGIDTHGALQLDPRGLSSLMDPGESVTIPAAGLELDDDEISDFVFSDAYDEFDDQDERRDALLTIGRAIFSTVLTDGAFDRETVSTIGAAAAAGHLKFVSFDPAASEALNGTGITWDLGPPSHDEVMVTAQNFGGGGGAGSKMDFWARRSLRHDCAIRADAPARCATEVQFENKAPAGLTTYVAGRPYAMLRDYVEVFVPEMSDLLAVEQDGRPVEFRNELQAGRKSIGIYMELPRGEQTTLSVTYELPFSEEFTLEAIPQPLAEDARIEVELTPPSHWLLMEGPADASGDSFVYQGDLDERLRFRLGPDRRPGLTGLWGRLTRFWSDPVL
jgi:hypothetical protein